MAELMLVAEGGLQRVKEMLATLKRKDILARILPPAGGCITG